MADPNHEPIADPMLNKVRKLLAQAEDDACTPAEAEAFTAKAAQLIAKYGIDRAMLAAVRPETDTPSSRLIDVDNPWGRVKAHLLCGLGSALRCQCIMLTGRSDVGERAARIHVFGYQSDIERLDVLYTSILIQMWHGLAGAQVPEWSRSPRAWRRSWLLGFTSAVTARVRQAERAAQDQSDQDRAAAAHASGKSAAVVLASRDLVVRGMVQREYPKTRTARLTYSGTGYGAGHAKGQQADIGQRRMGGRAALNG
jgi:Protein of unknown function (DUF2786)